jgi:methylmalonyl-CoA mutase C-terminal domain/subunit
MARIVLAKLGSDAHDLGVTTVARWLREGGHEVVYAGLYNTPERVAQIALQEDAALVGVSCLSSDPVHAGRRVRQTLARVGLAHVPLVVGGVITRDMTVELGRLGVAAAFGPGTPRERLLESVARLLSGSGGARGGAGASLGAR